MRGTVWQAAQGGFGRKLGYAVGAVVVAAVSALLGVFR